MAASVLHRAGESRPASAAAALLTGAAAAGAVVVLALRNPHVPGSYLGCPVFVLTGMVCAGCGALRAVHDLATGDLASAWAMNPFLVAAVPLALVAWGAWLLRATTGRGQRLRLSDRWRTRAPWLLLGVLVLISVARNVPVLVPWLGPALG